MVECSPGGSVERSGLVPPGQALGCRAVMEKAYYLFGASHSQ